jgi:transcriptional regulator with XRE-family HTH domain
VKQRRYPRDGFGEFLRLRRSALGLTQEELAERSRLSIRAIADMESGRTSRPYRHSVQCLAEALGMSDPDRELLERLARPGAAGHPSAPGLSRQARPAAMRSWPALCAPRQLPSAIPHFAGRAAERRTLTSVLAAAEAGICAIVGAAGVGKTALAVRWAHQAADRFPDGQLYVDLRGFDPSADPVPAAEAIRGFLDALGVPPGMVPASTQAQGGLYRSLLAGLKVLLVLDNARDPAQVRPLLPGNSSSMVVVTSRDQFTGLVAADGAVPLFLDVLGFAESWELLACRLGACRLAGEPQAAADLIGRCAGLPLALAIVAARAAAGPALPLRELAADLRTAGRRLDAMDTGDAATSLRAMLACSLRVLSEPAAGLFRLLALHPGPDLSVADAVGLAGVTTAQARALLGELARCHLVTEQSPGRFTVDDIVRAYASELALTRGDQLRDASGWPVAEPAVSAVSPVK